MIRLPALVLAIAFAASPALAHKVILSVFPSGSQIEGELGFSNGDVPPAGQIVEIFDSAGRKLGQAASDAEGFFRFTPGEAVELVFKADLGAGHVAETYMEGAEVLRIVDAGKTGAQGAAAATIPWAGGAGSPAAQPAGEVPPGIAPGPTPEETSGMASQITVNSLTVAERDAIAEAVRNEVRPLRREIAAYKEKNDLQTILGGIGYIAGLFGVGFYVAARRRLKGPV